VIPLFDWKPIVAGGALFDGTDRMQRGAGLTGAADSKTGILSFWAFQPGLSATEFPFAAANRVSLQQNANGSFSLNARNSANTIILSLHSVGGYTGAWAHILMSWDLAASATHVYGNDASDKSVTVLTNDTIDYTDTDWCIGSLSGGGIPFSGSLAEFYFAPGQFLDLSIEANRRKFITKTKRPMFLGADGSLPTGVAPLIYQKIFVGEAIADFATNRGSGGNFSITGALDAAASSPSG
jgi:hypothetical protein